MNGYVLAVLSHGDPRSPYAEGTLGSFVERVRPLPVVTVMYHDGPGRVYAGAPAGQKILMAGGEQLGFCGATRHLWEGAILAASTFKCQHVFWLEHDFTFERDVDVDAMAELLDRLPVLAQVSLMRQAVNSTERRAGGLFESRRGDFVQHGGYTVDRWLEHRAYFTTNPSLMRVAFMAQHTFGDDRRRLPHDIECEGRFGAQLVEDGWRFAVMGNGEPWVRHIGERNGKGY